MDSQIKNCKASVNHFTRIKWGIFHLTNTFMVLLQKNEVSYQDGYQTFTNAVSECEICLKGKFEEIIVYFCLTPQL